MSNKSIWLTRDEFRESVFKRDNYKCVFCGEPAKDAHHIIERRLFGKTGGYAIDNGASVCHEHHMLCETTELSVDEVREKCGITAKIIPDHLYSDTNYDKWGNVIMEDGHRAIGELFFDQSIQWVLNKGGMLDKFTKYVKYPRTYHLPWSGCIGKDDRVFEDLTNFNGSRVIVTKKMDGSNVTMYNDFIHGRTFNHRSHPISGRVKALWSQFQANIPDGWRVCGEDLYHTHSIQYNNLTSFLYCYSIWDHENNCISWDETVEYFQLMDLSPVEVLYDGIWDENLIKSLTVDYAKCEGYVVRKADKFSMFEFKNSVAKFVRPDHHHTVIHNLAMANQGINTLK